MVCQQVASYLVSCPDYFSGKNSLVNCLFVPSAMFVALQSCCFMQMTSRTALEDGYVVEALCRRLRLVEPENDWRRNSRTSVNGRCVFPSLKTGSVKFLRLSNVDKIVLGLSEVDRGFMFCEASFLGFFFVLSFV